VCAQQQQYGQYGGGGGQYGQPQQPQVAAQQYGQYGGGGRQYDVIDGFDPARAFGGARPGWVFKTGGHGPGYYREAAAGQPQQPQFAQPATLKVRPIRVQSEVIRCIQKPSAGLTGPQWPSVALRGYQRSSKSSSGNQEGTGFQDCPDGHDAC